MALSTVPDDRSGVGVPISSVTASAKVLVAGQWLRGGSCDGSDVKISEISCDGSCLGSTTDQKYECAKCIATATAKILVAGRLWGFAMTPARVPAADSILNLRGFL